MEKLKELEELVNAIKWDIENDLIDRMTLNSINKLKQEIEKLLN